MRIRTIKGEFWTDEKVVELSAWARLMFIGLWNMADDWGLMEWSSKRAKMLLFPADEVDVEALVDELETMEMVTMYENDGRKYLAVNNFHRHQRTDKRGKLRFPPPDSGWFERFPRNPTESRGNSGNPTEPHGIPTTPAEIPGKPPRKGKGKGKGNIPPLSPKGEVRRSRSLDPEVIELARSTFDRFWAEWPRRDGKKPAWDKWCSKKCWTRIEEILTAVRRQKGSKQWTKDGGDFIPLPATWLNQERWEDQGTSAPAGDEGDGRRDVYVPLSKRGGDEA